MSQNMSSLDEEDYLLFATQIGGPMTFTFSNLLKDEVNELTDLIKNYGGEVIEYKDRNKFTIVLTKKDAQLNNEIQFNRIYIHDCIKKNEILPLETYRLGKKVEYGCFYSKPWDSAQCIFSKLIHPGKCNKHQISTHNKSKEEKSTPDLESTLEDQLEFMNSQIYVRRDVQLKKEPESLELKNEPQSQPSQEVDVTNDDDK